MKKKISELLLEKIKREFPEIKHPEGELQNLHRVFSSNHSATHKWTNLGYKETFIYSWDTMSDCLNKAISAEYFNDFRIHGSSDGWIITVKSTHND